MSKMTKFSAMLLVALCLPAPCIAQITEPRLEKIQEGIYAYVGRHFGPDCKSANCVESNAGIVITREGVVLIDTGQNPTDSRLLLAEARKLTPLPVRYVLHTEPHPDHTTGDFLFSPPARVLAYQGAVAEMKSRPADRAAQLAKLSPEMARAVEGYRPVFPEEFEGRKIILLGERTFELFNLPNVHSEADVAVWLPKERVLFSASGIVVQQWNVMRPFVTIPAILDAARTMKALNPVAVIPGHGAPGTVKIFEDTEAHYAVVLARVQQLAREGKSLDAIKKEARFPEYSHWLNPGRIPQVIDTAYKSIAR